MHKCQVKPGQRQAWYSVEAAAAYLTIGPTAIYKAIQQRQLKHARFGKSIRISDQHLGSWVEEQTKPTVSEIELAALRKQKTAIRVARTKKATGRPYSKSKKRHIWPPTTTRDLQILAHCIEDRMLAEQSSKLTAE